MQNSLELEFVKRQRFRKPKPKTPVTIVIGVICKEGILVESDSRTTNPDHTIRDNAIKVRLLRLAGPDNAIIAQAGDDDLGSRVVDRIEHLAEQTPLTDWQTVSDIGDRAIADEQKKLRTPFEGVGFSMEEFQNVLRGHDVTFLLAYYFKGKPYIFTTDFYPGKFTRRQSSHFSTGCGSPLANFLLEGFDFSKLNIWEATAILIYVIEEVKRFDPRCGGATKIGVQQSMGFMRLEGRPDHPAIVTSEYPKDQIEEFISQISKTRSKFKDEWDGQLKKIMAEMTAWWLKRRCSNDRFIRMRYGQAAFDVLQLVTKHISENGNDEARKLINDFSLGLGNGMKKPDLKNAWERVCQTLPSVTQLPNVSVEISKLF